MKDEKRNEKRDVAKCLICGQTFEPRDGDFLFCDICLREIRRVIELARDGLL